MQHKIPIWDSYGASIVWDFIIIFLAIFGAFSLWKISKQVRLGVHLTRMTNVFEKIEQSRYDLPIGAGGGVDSLSKIDQLEAERVLTEGLQFLRKFPRHVISRETMKNALLANRMGRNVRHMAIERMYEWLVEMDVALDIDEFTNSYG